MRILKTLTAKDWFRAILGRLIAGYVRLVWRTSRWTTVGATDHVQAWDDGRPFIACFWHGRLMMMPMSLRSGERICVLISGHRDGRILAAAMRPLGIATQSGSTSHGGVEALRSLLRTLSSGISLGLTPDGPRGPRMRASLGVVTVARLSGAPIIPVAFATTRRRVLGSWDRFVLALPFGRGVFVWGEAIPVPRDADPETVRRRVEDAMNRVTAEADRRCGHEPMAPAVAHPGAAPTGAAP